MKVLSCHSTSDGGHQVSYHQSGLLSTCKIKKLEGGGGWL